MNPAPAYVASDAHLGASPPEMEKAFSKWLEYAGECASLLFLNGDLFDFWFEWGSVVPSGHTRVLGILASIVDGGVPVHLMGGNHDWWGGRYLSEEIGLTLHHEEVRISLAGQRCLVAHGDGLGGGDLGYRMLKGVLRGSVSRRAFRWVHPDIATAIARRVSRTDAHGGPDAKGRAAALENWARSRIASDEELDAVILGHCHIPARVEVEPGRFYLNAGDWLTHATYLVLDEGSPPQLLSWDGS
jgi:UDP-2,3-diacylglucosamine hydrolase